jgi:hypothetical protein
MCGIKGGKIDQLLIHADNKIKTTWSKVTRKTGKKCFSEHLQHYSKIKIP